jgi:hypothetical protein
VRPRREPRDEECGLGGRAAARRGAHVRARHRRREALARGIECAALCRAVGGERCNGRAEAPLVGVGRDGGAKGDAERDGAGLESLVDGEAQPLAPARRGSDEVAVRGDARGVGGGGAAAGGAAAGGAAAGGAAAGGAAAGARGTAAEAAAADAEAIAASTAAAAAERADATRTSIVGNVPTLLLMLSVAVAFSFGSSAGSAGAAGGAGAAGAKLTDEISTGAKSDSVLPFTPSIEFETSSQAASWRTRSGAASEEATRRRTAIERPSAAAAGDARRADGVAAASRASAGAGRAISTFSTPPFSWASVVAKSALRLRRAVEGGGGRAPS